MFLHQPRNKHPIALIAVALVTFLSILGSAAATGILPLPVALETVLSSVPFGANHHLQENSNAPENQEPGATENSPATITMNPGEPAREARLCRICGVIESVRTTQIDNDAKIPGATVRNSVSVVPGNQKPLLTIIGSNTHARHGVENHLKSTTAYIVRVRMTDGTYRTITQADRPQYAIGESVKVVSGALTTA